MDHTVKSLHRLLSGSNNYVYDASRPINFLVGIWKKIQASAAIADSILPLWRSGRVGQKFIPFAELMEHPLELDGAEPIT